VAVDSRVERLTFAFWNLNQQNRIDLVCRLVAERQIDVLVLAESDSHRDATLAALRSEVAASFSEPETVTPRLCLFSRRAELDLHEVYGDASGRLTIRVLRFADTEFLLVAAHLVSKWNWRDSDQSTEIQELSSWIRSEETRQQHMRTLLCGDLNMNPFDDGVVKAAGLHAMMTKATTRERSRRVQGRDYPFFYNPMWGFFGDRTDGPPGTMYYRDSGHTSFEWNMIDQVLIRPDALPWFSDDIEIVTRIGDTELSDAIGRPDKETGSDHFPLLFRLVSPS
jgi:endonuclease/exonuclease/phosphatase (EEP) superfamily protein YafD